MHYLAVSPVAATGDVPAPPGPTTSQSRPNHTC